MLCLFCLSCVCLFIFVYYVIIKFYCNLKMNSCELMFFLIMFVIILLINLIEVSFVFVVVELIGLNDDYFNVF